MAGEPRLKAPWLRAKRRILSVTGVAAYSAVAVAGEPWTLYSSIFTAIPGLAVAWYAIRRGWHRFRREAQPFCVDAVGALGLMIWTLLIVLLAVWVLAIFYSHPRSTYPTLSHLMNIVFENYALRVGGFMGWLAMGWYLLRR